MLNAAAAPLWMTQAIRCENALKKKARFAEKPDGYSFLFRKTSEL